MVYQRYSRRARERGSTRCLHCGYGCGQFAVQYYEDGFGRGYCSLDCYTSAKVRQGHPESFPRFWRWNVTWCGMVGGSGVWTWTHFGGLSFFFKTLVSLRIEFVELWMRWRAPIRQQPFSSRRCFLSLTHATDGPMRVACGLLGRLGAASRWSPEHKSSRFFSRRVGWHFICDLFRKDGPFRGWGRPRGHPHRHPHRRDKHFQTANVAVGVGRTSTVSLILMSVCTRLSSDGRAKTRKAGGNVKHFLTH